MDGMDGNATWTCKEDGTWESPDPTCCESHTHTLMLPFDMISRRCFDRYFCLLVYEYSHRPKWDWEVMGLLLQQHV